MYQKGVIKEKDEHIEQLMGEIREQKDLIEDFEDEKTKRESVS